jgi:uncharacterized protein CbrC (UPF0167 family)
MVVPTPAQYRCVVIAAFQMIARVLETGDADQYCPFEQPNTHWRFWPDGVPRKTAMDEQAERERLAWAVSRLPASCRLAAQMHHLMGLPPEEIEDSYNLAEGEARRQLDEAERLLPDLMQATPPVDPVAVPARGFRYLLDPAAEVTGQTDPQPCVACGEARPGFDLVVYHDDGFLWDRYYVCDPCLRAGRLVERGLRVNEGDSEALTAQLAATQPDLFSRSRLPFEEREALAQERTREVECCTPRPDIWQQFIWPAHCGDYFGYVRQVRKADLIALAPDGDGRAFFAAHVYPEEPDGDVWEEGFAPEGFVNVYLWRCLHCRSYRITWDHE